MWLWLCCLAEEGWPKPWPEQEAPVSPHLTVTDLVQSQGCPRKQVDGALQVPEAQKSPDLGKRESNSPVTGSRASLCLELWVQKNLPPSPPPQAPLESVPLCALHLPVLTWVPARPWQQGDREVMCQVRPQV